MTDAELDELMLVFDVDQSHTIDAVGLAPAPTLDSIPARPPFRLPFPPPPPLPSAPHSPAPPQDEFEELVRVCLNIPLSPPRPACHTADDLRNPDTEG